MRLGTVLTGCAAGNDSGKLAAAIHHGKDSMTLFRTLLALASALAVTSTAHAEIGVTGEFGSTGVGTHATIPLNEQLNLRLGANYLRLNHRGSTADLDYDIKLRTRTWDALLDWHPLRDSGLRLTAGAALNGNRLDVRARANATGTYVIGGRRYSAADAGTIDGAVSYRKLAPYLGVGWGNAARPQGWKVSADLGVLFQGSPSTRLESRDCGAPGALCAQLASDVARERQSLDREARKLRFYPVLRVGISKSF